MSLTAPAWLMLIWCGLAAACAAAVPATIVGGVPRGTWSLAPRPRSRLHGAAWSLLAGGVVYPILYGVLFETLNRSDLRIGLVAGAIHGLIAFLLARPRTTFRAAARAGTAHLVYGAMIAFLYVTP
jgi:hypothetical protein